MPTLEPTEIRFTVTIEEGEASAGVAPRAAPSRTPEHPTEEIAPCTPAESSSVDPCEPDEYWITAVTRRLRYGPNWGNEPRTVRQFLDGYSVNRISHIVLRGTYIPDSVRCESGIPYRTPSYADPDDFIHVVGTMPIQCYADVRANAYILGSGPSRLTVLVSQTPHWEGTVKAIAAHTGKTEEELPTEEEFADKIIQIQEIILVDGYDPIGDDPARDGEGIYGREALLFIGPSNNHATEVWQEFETWDIQRQEDGTVVAVYPARYLWRRLGPDEYQTHRSVLEMELPDFSRAVTAAHQARIAEYDGRIAPENIEGRAEGVELPMLVTDANRLSQFYADTGAYDHPDGPPVQPPPVYGN